MYFLERELLYKIRKTWWISICNNRLLYDWNEAILLELKKKQFSLILFRTETTWLYVGSHKKMMLNIWDYGKKR